MFIYLPLFIIIIIILYFIIFYSYYSASSHHHEPIQQEQQEQEEHQQDPQLPRKLGKKKLLHKQRRQEQRNYNQHLIDLREDRLRRREEREEAIMRRRKRHRRIQWGLVFKEIWQLVQFNRTKKEDRIDPKMVLEHVRDLKSVLIADLMKEYKITKEQVSNILMNSNESGLFLVQDDQAFYLSETDLKDIEEFIIEKGCVTKDQLLQESNRILSLYN